MQGGGSNQIKNPTVMFDALTDYSNGANYVYSSIYSSYDEFIIRDAPEVDKGKLFGKEVAGYNNWQMYTYTYNSDDNIIYLYINGQLAGRDASGSYGTVNKLMQDAYLYLGVNLWSGNAVNGAFAGYLDGLYIYERVLTAEEISSAYNVLENKGEYKDNVITTVFAPSTVDFYRCGVVYERGIELQHQQNDDDSGKIVITSEYYAGTRMNDQPTLYELPEDGGRLPAGTVLCTGVAASLDTTATDTANDSNGSKHTRIDIYYSTDACNTWNFLSYVTDGGESRVDIGDAMWESNLILESGKLYCFYADERGLS